MKTTSFHNIKDLENLSGYVSIALYKPGGFKRKIREAPELFQGKSMELHGYAYEDYVRLLQRRNLTPKAVYKKYRTSTFVCHGKHAHTSHRRMLARWLEEGLDITIEEM